MRVRLKIGGTSSALHYTTARGIPRESRQRFHEVRTANFGQAARIPGVRPSDIAALHVYVEKLAREKREAVPSPQEMG